MTPLALFERRVRAVVRLLQYRYPQMSRYDAMTRARQVPPAMLPTALRVLRTRTAKGTYAKMAHVRPVRVEWGSL